VPVPTLAELNTMSDAMVWDFLAQTDPIDGTDYLALQVAQITLGMGRLKARIEALEAEREKHGRS
jgi:hypothetical protein